MGEAPSEMLAHPVTLLLLAVNLLYAYYLWSRRVSNSHQSSQKDSRGGLWKRRGLEWCLADVFC